MAPQRKTEQPDKGIKEGNEGGQLSRDQPNQKGYLQLAIRQHHPQRQETEQGGWSPPPGDTS